jgi:hypothetical protein
MVDIFLPSDAQAIKISGDQPWCTVSLTYPDGERVLGAEDLDILKDRFVTLMISRDSLRINGRIQQQDVAWVLTLSEGHTSLYASRTATGLMLFFQDKDGEVFSALDVTDAQCDQWLAELTDGR